MPARRKTSPKRARPKQNRATKPRPRPAKPAPRPATAAARDPAAPRIVASTPVRVGTVMRYFARAHAALVALEGALAIGDWIHVRGATSDFVQGVTSLRAGEKRAARAASGEIGVRLEQRARPGDAVFVLRAAE